jgi:hypothetical protein
MGKSPAWVNGVVKGTRGLPLKYADQIAACYGLPVAALFDAPDQPRHSHMTQPSGSGEIDAATRAFKERQFYRHVLEEVAAELATAAAHAQHLLSVVRGGLAHEDGGPRAAQSGRRRARGKTG